MRKPAIFVASHFILFFCAVAHSSAHAPAEVKKLEKSMKIGVVSHGESFEARVIAKSDRGFCKRLTVPADITITTEELLNKISMGSYDIEYKLMTKGDVCDVVSENKGYFSAHADSTTQYVLESAMNLLWDWRSGNKKVLTVVGTKKHIACLQDPKITMVFGVFDPDTKTYSMVFYNNKCASEENSIRIGLKANFSIEKKMMTLTTDIKYLRP